MSPTLAGVALMAIGLFSLLGAIMNWDWYMNHRKARALIAIMGRGGARVFYGLLGMGIMGMGAAWAMRLLP